MIGLTLAGGIAAAVALAPSDAFLSQLVPERELTTAVGLYSMTYHLARAAGPALATLLVTTVGFGWTFALNAASFLVLLPALALTRPRQQQIEVHRPRPRWALRPRLDHLRRDRRARLDVRGRSQPVLRDGDRQRGEQRRCYGHVHRHGQLQQPLRAYGAVLVEEERERPLQPAERGAEGGGEGQARREGQEARRLQKEGAVRAADAGGGLANAGRMTIASSFFEQNATLTPQGSGGGNVYNSGSLTLSNSGITRGKSQGPASRTPAPSSSRRARCARTTASAAARLPISRAGGCR